MPQTPNSQQLVTGKDGKKYQVVIDPKVGLQTFIPYREPQQQRPQTQGMPGAMQQRPQMPGQAMPGRMDRVQQMGQQQGQPQGGEMMNKLRGLLAARG